MLIASDKLDKKRLFEIIEEIKHEITANRKDFFSEKDEIFFKVFFYPSKFKRVFRSKGLYSLLIYLVLKHKKINIPEFLFYYSFKNFEIFAYKKVEGVEVIEFLRQKHSKKDVEKFILDFKNFLKSFFKINIYHKDFDPTNIIYSSKKEFYIIDFEAIVPFSFSNKKVKMLQKLNRFFLSSFGFSIDKKDVLK